MLQDVNAEPTGPPGGRSPVQGRVTASMPPPPSTTDEVGRAPFGAGSDSFAEILGIAQLHLLRALMVHRRAYALGKPSPHRCPGGSQAER